MIDDVLFTMEFERLWRRFGRKRVDDDVATGYYDYLSPKLDNKQFRGAMLTMFAEADRWPTPAEILMAAPPPDTPLLPPGPDSIYEPRTVYVRRDSREHRAMQQAQERHRHDPPDDGTYRYLDRKSGEWKTGRYWIEDCRGLRCHPHTIAHDGRGIPLIQVEVID